MASPKQEKSKKKGFTARMKTLFRKPSRSAIPAQQVVSQTQHYGSERSPTHYWQPPTPPDHGLMERHLARIASFDELPQVQTYPNFDGQVVRVARGSHTSLDDIGSFRQPSSETKDTWERGTALTGTASSRVTSGRRLTVLMEDEVASPSSSVGQVGILSRLKSFEQPVQDFTNQDPRRHASGLARAIRERQRVENEDHGDENETDENSSVIRWRGRTTVDDYDRAGTSSRQEVSFQLRSHSHSNQKNAHSWSQQPTIRRVSSSSNAGDSHNLQQSQIHNSQVQRQMNNKARSTSPATESVYSKDEDGIPVWRERVSPNSDQSLHYDRRRLGSSQQAPTAPRMNVETYSQRLENAVAADENRTGGCIVDYYSGEPSPSVARSSLSSANLNLTYPRDTSNQDISFHGATNDRLQHIPPQFNLRDFISAQRSLEAQEAKRQPSLAQLREQIRNEDAAQLAAARLAIMQPEILQVRSILPRTMDSANRERTNIESPYPPWRSEIIREVYSTADSISSRHQAHQSAIPPEQVLASRELNRSQASLTSASEKEVIDPEKTPRPQRSQQDRLRLEKKMHAHGLMRRSRSSNLSGFHGNLGFVARDMQDPFLQEQGDNVWASRSSSRTQQEVGLENTQQPSRTLPENRSRTAVDDPHKYVGPYHHPHEGLNMEGREWDGGFF